VDQPLSATWVDNADRLYAIWSEWWGYRVPRMEFRRREDHRPKTTAAALAFTCGVDSFFSLLTGPKPDFLVSVHGFDVDLADRRRMDAFSASVRAVAREMGITSLAISTNLREHSVSGPRRLWERAHGGGIASIGHFLSGHIGELVISSSYSRRSKRPWGSTGDTDSLFSSDLVSISHYGLDDFRESKIARIAASPLAQKHLRVCWENRAPTGNCSHCGKCLATMLVLAELHALESFSVFDPPPLLASRLNALPYLRNNINIVQRIVNRGALEPAVSDAARRLLLRSRRAASIRGYGERLRAGISRFG
jgi:hypothetical protein